MLELGEPSNVRMTYSEAMMYCFSLGPGWRLPTLNELAKNRFFSIGYWYKDKNTSLRWEVIPVRDI